MNTFIFSVNDGLSNIQSKSVTQFNHLESSLPVRQDEGNKISKDKHVYVYFISESSLSL